MPAFGAQHSRDVANARIELLLSRTGVLLFYGSVLYPLFFILDWRERPWDKPAALIIRITGAVVILVIARLCNTKWGRSRAVLLASLAFLIAHAGFAALVWHAKGLGSSNGDAFELFFGPYCVLIPTTTLNAALVGLCMLTIHVATYVLAGSKIPYDDIIANAALFSSSF
jgi:hypothetical protein